MRFNFLCLVLLICGSFSLPRTAFSQTPVSTPAEKARETLEKALNDANPEKRQQAVIALSLQGAMTTTYAQIEKALADKDVQVRVTACASLAALRDKRSIKLLEKALRDEVPEVSFAAGKALYELGSPLGRDIMLDILSGEKKTSSNFITSEMRDAVRLMKNPNALTRLAVREGIGMIPLPGLSFGFTSLEGLLRDSGMTGRALAATMLAREKDKISLKILRDSLDDKEWSVRAAVVHALALRGQAEVKNDLIALLDDKKDEVRLRAAAAYLRFDGMSKRKSEKR